MAEYFISDNNLNPVWRDLAEALEVCTADVSSSSREEWEAKGCALIRNTVEKYGGGRVVCCILETLKGDCFWELYWLARAGVVEVEPHLIALLVSEDQDDFVSAVAGLLYFDNELAWQSLDMLVKGEHIVELDQPLAWYFQEDLENINNQKSKVYLDLITTTD